MNRLIALTPAAPLPVALMAALPCAGLAPAAAADSYSNLGRELAARRFVSSRETTEVDVDGYFRVRGETLYNLDLDHGLTPSGQPLFPVPLDGQGQALSTADTRLRTDVAIYPRGVGVAVKARIDVLDNLALGSTPEGSPSTTRAPTPAASPGQRPPERAFLVRQAWGEVLTPFGVLAAGRIGNDWGLGMLANDGSCEGCDSGDAADRIAFATPAGDGFASIAFDIASSGPLTRRVDNARPLDILPSDDVRTLTLAGGRIRSPSSLRRRAAANLVSVDFGGYLAHRWQNDDVPASYLPTATPVVIDASQVMRRGFRSTGASAWARVTGSRLRIEAELAYLRASIDEPSLIPGFELGSEVTSDQLGIAVETDFWPAPWLELGSDGGYASGDSAPGFGAFPRASADSPLPGDLDGPQADLIRDTDVDNFRFHPDYRIDKILFREIIGTVTDAVYLRPHLRLRRPLGPGVVSLAIAAIASWAAEPNSTPGGERHLGVELDPTLRYQALGFIANLDYAVFFPGGGFDNRLLGRSARTAQLLRLRLEYLF